MIDNHAVEEIVSGFPDWKNQKLVVSLKPWAGKTYIDARKFIACANGFNKGTKGLMLDVDKWPKVIAMVQEMLDRQGIKSTNE